MGLNREEEFISNSDSEGRGLLEMGGLIERNGLFQILIQRGGAFFLEMGGLIERGLDRAFTVHKNHNNHLLPKYYNQ